ncbi:MAG: DUF488 domain-containing protein [Chloroflexi bacterium]|nr:DUF488 domain-containing protein [Chloroflexota bacterium]
MTHSAEPHSVVYTIGHSNHTTTAFLDLLVRYEIATIVDVRSQPHSRWVPQFNRETLAQDLDAAGIRYLYMGDVLGGRPDDPALYVPGEERPDYRRMEAMASYQEAIARLLALATNERVAIMCSEGDHRMCHRHLLISQTLLARDAVVWHIESDGGLLAGEYIAQQLTLF